jgi:hypothetical protein
MAFLLFCLFSIVSSQLDEFGAKSRSFSFAQTVLAHPITAIVACLIIGASLLVGLIYLRKIIENMRDVEVLIKPKQDSKEDKTLLSEISSN